MSDARMKVTRRRFVGVGAATVLGSTIPTVLGVRTANATDLPQLDESDGTAKALGYVHDATTVDLSTRGAADRICRSCRFYTEPASETWGPCTLFPGKSVNANGWCKSWITRAG